MRLWKVFCDCFNCLPTAAVIDEKIFCIHGGLSPELSRLDQIQHIARPTDVPDTGLLCDFLWSDPDKDISGWGENDRGVSFTFGPDVVAHFLKNHDFDLIVRAHQVTSPVLSAETDGHVASRRLSKMVMNSSQRGSSSPFFRPPITVGSSTMLVP